MSVTDAGSARRGRASKVPVHLWIVGGLALLWNAVGAFDYLATQLQFEPYMSGFSVVIGAVAILLFAYARSMARRGVLD